MKTSVKLFLIDDDGVKICHLASIISLLNQLGSEDEVNFKDGLEGKALTDPSVHPLIVSALSDLNGAVFLLDIEILPDVDKLTSAVLTKHSQVIARYQEVYSILGAKPSYALAAALCAVCDQNGSIAFLVSTKEGVADRLNNLVNQVVDFPQLDNYPDNQTPRENVSERLRQLASRIYGHWSSMKGRNLHRLLPGHAKEWFENERTFHNVPSLGTSRVSYLSLITKYVANLTQARDETWITSWLNAVELVAFNDTLKTLVGHCAVCHGTKGTRVPCLGSLALVAAACDPSPEQWLPKLSWPIVRKPTLPVSATKDLTLRLIRSLACDDKGFFPLLLRSRDNQEQSTVKSVCLSELELVFSMKCSLRSLAASLREMKESEKLPSDCGTTCQAMWETLQALSCDKKGVCMIEIDSVADKLKFKFVSRRTTK